MEQQKNAFAYNYERIYLKDLPLELQPYFKENKYHNVGTLYFDEQDIYEIVEVKSDTLINKEAMLILLKNIKSDCYVVSEENKKIIEDLLSYYN